MVASAGAKGTRTSSPPRLRKRRDSEGLREDMEKFAPSPRDLGGRFFCLTGGDNSLGAKLVRCDREYYPEGDWTAEDNRYYGIAIFIFLVWAAINVWQDKDSFAYNSDVNYIFWLRMFVTLSFNLLISSVVGYFVVHRDWHIGYSRKLLHFCLFASPVVVNSTLGAMDTKILGLSWLSLACQAYFVLMLKPVRRRLPVPLLLMFRALDRPQDRPYTITLALPPVRCRIHRHDPAPDLPGEQADLGGLLRDPLGCQRPWRRAPRSPLASSGKAQVPDKGHMVPRQGVLRRDR